MRDEVFNKIPDPGLRIYAVWQPILPRDAAEELPQATALLAHDARVLQFWDPRAEIGRRFSRALGLPMTTPAWDVYLLYPPGTRWTGQAPTPAFWMHQLGFPPWSKGGEQFSKLRLDGERFRQEVEKLLLPEPQKRSR